MNYNTTHAHASSSASGQKVSHDQLLLGEWWLQEIAGSLQQNMALYLPYMEESSY